MPRRLAGSFVLIATTVALLAGLALAGRDATIEATRFRVPADNAAEGFAECRGKKRALGGGVLENGSPTLRVLASGPLDASGRTDDTRDGDKATQWYADVDSLSGEGRDAKVFAICSAASKATIEATDLRVPGRSSVAWAFARCRGNKRALGGGIVPAGQAASTGAVFANAPRALNLYVRASGPLDASGRTDETRDRDIAKQWYAAVGNTSHEAQDAKVFAICSAASKATIEATEFKVPGRGTAGEFARCRGNKRALGGGVVQKTLLAEYVHASGPLDAAGVTESTRDGDTAKQWYAAVSNLSNREMAAKVFAICE